MRSMSSRIGACNPGLSQVSAPVGESRHKTQEVLTPDRMMTFNRLCPRTRLVMMGGVVRCMFGIYPFSLRQGRKVTRSHSASYVSLGFKP